MSSHPLEFSGVTVTTKANIYFDGKVVSHTVKLSTGEKKTLGLIFPGTYHFNTAEPELMQIVAGECEVVLDGSTEKTVHGEGMAFAVEGGSGFAIEVTGGVCEYICSFLPVQ